MCWIRIGKDTYYLRGKQVNGTFQIIDNYVGGGSEALMPLQMIGARAAARAVRPAVSPAADMASRASGFSR